MKNQTKNRDSRCAFVVPDGIDACNDEIAQIFSPVRLQSQMSKTRMRKQTRERISAGFANVGVRLDALQSIQPHMWKYLEGNDGAFGNTPYFTALLDCILIAQAKSEKQTFITHDANLTY